jgi:cytochrome c553
MLRLPLIALVMSIALDAIQTHADETFSQKVVKFDQPTSDRSFASGPGSDAINDNCLICHSAGMVLNQPIASKAEWRGVVEQMRTAFKAPIDPKDVDAIADYLFSIRGTDNAKTSAQISGRSPDLNHGAVIAAQGTHSGAPPCAQCHAFNGGSDGSGAFPRIAGQSIYYLTKQLRDFASGVRNNAIMSPIAKALSADDIADVTVYYNSVAAPFLPLGNAAGGSTHRAEQLATVGDAAKDLPACNNCHGPGGTGEPPAIPYLAGQYAQYIAFELNAWRNGYRKSSPEIMRKFANKLDDQEIAALAAYYQELHFGSQTTALK